MSDGPTPSVSAEHKSVHHAALTRLAPYKHAVASQVASVVATVTFYPFDVIKMRFMSHDGTAVRRHNGMHYTHLWRSLFVVAQEEGIRALYRGSHVAVIGSAAAWGSYMFVYKELQRIVLALDLGEGQSASAVVVCSAAASSLANTLSCPIFLIKARMQLEERQTGQRVAEHHYASLRGGLRHVVQTTGLFSLWRGLSAQLLLGLPNCLNLPVYEYLSELRRSFRPEDKRDGPLDFIDVCAISTTSKTILSFISHPLFVVKTRLQDQRSREGEVVYRSLTQSSTLMWKREGLRGFYRGLVPALAQAVPRSITQFVCYEYCLRNLW